MKETKSKKQNTYLCKKMNSKKGITLIALIITIIVMLILVGVTISISMQGGLFGYAKKAAKDTKTSIEQEQALANGDIIDYLVNVSQEVQNLPDYAKAEKTEGILTENAKYVEGGKAAVVPKGFAIVEDEKGKKSIAEGLVITDEVDSKGKSIGNEYVWVPVEDGELNRTEWANNAPTGYIYDWYTETLPEDLVNSVKTNKGFYIGRYEAGSISVRTSATKDTLTKILTKKGLYPYNWVSQTNAISKIGEMYTNKKIYGVEATMPYGAMWDETLNFVRDDTHNVTNSTNWGNYENAIFKFTGEYCATPDADEPKYTKVNNEDKPKDKIWLLTTGASEQNKAKNIYDLAGNVEEWTQESSSSTWRVVRGGFYYADGNLSPASGRDDDFDSSNTSDIIGFRPALYIK